MAIKKGLGRGLDDLIPTKGGRTRSSETDHNKDNSEKGKTVTKKTRTATKKKDKEPAEDVPVEISINKIEPNRDQPRKQFDEDGIDELADSIKKNGLIQPIIVQKKDGYYAIVAGERRWRACKKAGLKKVLVVIRDYSEEVGFKISLIENIQRENLNPIEEAKAYEILHSKYHLKQDQIAESVSKSRTAITNIMRLLKLDEKVQNMIIENLISGAHGRTLLPIEDGEVQYQTAVKIMDEKLSVREAEKLVKSIVNKKEKKEEDTQISEQERQMISFFENKMKEIIGSKVSIKNKKNNRGRIEIEYYSKDELERIIDMIRSIGNH